MASEIPTHSRDHVQASSQNIDKYTPPTDIVSFLPNRKTATGLQFPHPLPKPNPFQPLPLGRCSPTTPELPNCSRPELENRPCPHWNWQIAHVYYTESLLVKYLPPALLLLVSKKGPVPSHRLSALSTLRLLEKQGPPPKKQET